MEKYGDPFEMINVKAEATNIQSTSAKVSLVSEGAATKGKTLTKKLLKSMTVTSLKAMCSKLFKIEVIHQHLVYTEEGYADEYPFDEEQRLLSFYGINDGGKIIVREVIQ